ncbi:hypothetical protein BVG79_00443 [Ketogulonicigenium robustum]|uniref:Endonuclease/exonuclease/phosphatase domain-containing protein n=1 Tax=Ketogulonicigenium robustum TaxID=92947 RepID=A0A1W6NXQ4_9RHOB|nr:endonuclease/exonuclease/phosphatase family protein [Ketogulonicigenium robustum]ARO13797.1 hypothetical protein BVG79_00443 [Ketogulonicigenium robustum]
MRLALSLAVITAAGLAPADTRIATWDAGLSRNGPGLLLRDILRADAGVVAAADLIATAQPDVLLLTGFDYDADGAALGAFAALLRARGLDYPLRLALPTNAGLPTGLDLNGNGRLGEAADAQGWGRFYGEGAMALLSRLPLAGNVQDYTPLLWADVAPLPDGLPAGAADVLRLSSNGHWVVPVETTRGPVDLLVFAATTPAFSTFNAQRNAAELALWGRYLNDTPRDFIVLGKPNLDPDAGAGDHAAMAAFLADPLVHDLRPAGDKGTATADWPDGPGALRVDYVLPSAALAVQGAGILWPAEAALTAHALVYIDLAE